VPAAADTGRREHLLQADSARNIDQRVVLPVGRGGLVSPARRAGPAAI